MRLGLSIGFFLCTLAACAQTTADVTITVVGPNGKPAQHVAVATSWMPNNPSLDGPMKPVGGGFTDENGVARFKARIEGKSVVFLARSSDERLGGFLAVPVDRLAQPQTLALSPMRAIRFSVQLPGGDALPSDASLAIYTVTDSSAHFSYAVKLKAKGSIKLPPGRYRFWPGGRGMSGGEVWATVPEGSGDFELEPFRPRLTALYRLSGKAPSLAIKGTTAPSKPMSLDRYRGKWIVLEFWGTWCHPCVEGMPHLASFYRKHAKDRGRFEILAVHDSTVKTMAELKAKMTPIEKRSWGGPLPFPILLDDGGKTVKAYGITEFPTMIIIDPQGNVVPSADLVTVEKALAAKR